MEAWFKTKIGSGKFLNGSDTPCYLDIHAFVIVERIVMFEKTAFVGAKEMNVCEAIPTVCAFV